MGRRNQPATFPLVFFPQPEIEMFQVSTELQRASVCSVTRFSPNAFKSSKVIEYCPKGLTQRQNETKSLSLPCATLKKKLLLLCHDQ